MYSKAPLFGLWLQYFKRYGFFNRDSPGLSRAVRIAIMDIGTRYETDDLLNLKYGSHA